MIWLQGPRELQKSGGAKSPILPPLFRKVQFYCIFMWQFFWILKVRGAAAPLDPVDTRPLDMNKIKKISWSRISIQWVLFISIFFFISNSLSSFFSMEVLTHAILHQTPKSKGLLKQIRYSSAIQEKNITFEIDSQATVDQTQKWTLPLWKNRFPTPCLAIWLANSHIDIH